MPPRLDRAIKRLSKQVLLITRYSPGVMVKGTYMPSVVPPTTFNSRGSVQAIQPKTIQFLQELERTRAKYIYYTGDKLQIINPPDTTVYKGDTYQFTADSDWQDQGHYSKYVMLKVEK